MSRSCMKWSIHEVRRRMVRIKTDASHFPRSGRCGVQGWLECRGIGGGGNSRFAGSALSSPRFERGLATPRPTRPPVSCVFLVVLGHRPTVATAKIHVRRRFLQRRRRRWESNGTSCRKIHVTGMRSPCAISRAGPGFRPARGVDRFANWNSARIRRCHRMSHFRRKFRRPSRSRPRPSRSRTQSHGSPRRTGG
jgi:hypothetical protein